VASSSTIVWSSLLSLWRKQDALRRCVVHLLDCHDRVVQRLTSHHHAGASTERSVIHPVVLVGRPVPDVVNVVGHESVPGCPAGDAGRKGALEHLRKQGQDVEPHDGRTQRSSGGSGDFLPRSGVDTAALQKCTNGVGWLGADAQPVVDPFTLQ